MAHYAFLDDNNIVIEVITGKDETELIDGITPEEWYSQFRGMKCVRTSFNSTIRGTFASVGYSYNEVENIFIAPQPFASWTRNGSFWQAPVAMPDDGQKYSWNESEGIWYVIP
jgi:hypothetical protein